MNTKIIAILIISLLIIGTLSIGTAAETDLQDTITISKNQTDTTGTVPIEVTKEEETTVSKDEPTISNIQPADTGKEA